MELKQQHITATIGIITAADSQLAECVDENTSTIRDNKLVVFDLSNSVKELFTVGQMPTGDKDMTERTYPLR